MDAPVPVIEEAVIEERVGGTLLTVTEILVLVVVLPAASRATAVRVCEPFVAVVESQEIE